MALPPELIDAMTRFSQCGAKGNTQICIVRYEAGSDRAVLVHFVKDCPNCAPNVTPLLRLPGGSWGQVNAEVADTPAEANNRRKTAASRGDIEIRTVERKQVFLGGEPVGQAFE